ncbi:MAG: ParA family protein [Deltaproteobacteria bacterium]|nr:ParA family protein [Deltaproteobacteria bacterium]
MASFKDICFTPSEFANLVKIERNQIPVLEEQGFLKTMKKRVGNVDRKMISLEGIREYCKQLQNIGRHGDQESTVTNQSIQDITPPTEGQNLAPVAAATGFAPQTLKHKIQMFYNVKGGTGKSTLTAQYVMRAAMMGYNILALDLDGQGHLTVNLDILDAHERPTIYDVLINDLPIQEAIINVAPGLDLVPGNLGLCNIEIPLNQKTRREYRLTESIKKISEHYDLIVADTNPAASILNCSMLVAADLVNVVCATNPLSFHGMSLVMATIEEMEKEFSRKLEVKIIPNFYDRREVISQEVLGELKIQFASHCSKTVINKTVDFNEATKRRTTVWDVNPRGVAALDLSALTEELLFN